MKGDYCFCTYSGVNVNPLALSADEVVIEDIAHHLACTNRYNGAASEPYSVAQHSVKCAWFALACDLGPRVMLGCLMHDAQEAYLGDVVSPIKASVYVDRTGYPLGDPLFEGWDDYIAWRTVEARTIGVICLGLGISPEETVWLPEVKTIDKIMLSAEMRALGFPEEAIPRVEVPAWAEGAEGRGWLRIRPWEWVTARERFLDLYGRITKQVRRTA